MKTLNDLPVLLEGFFTKRLIAQRRVSPHTVASYRDTFRLLLAFAQRRLNRVPSQLALTDLNAPFLAAFLDHLEAERLLSARSRNVRLAAIRSFFRYAALEAPQHAALIQRVLAIQPKRYSRRLVDYLARAEIDALLSAPDRNTWVGERDHAFLLTAVQTGLRLSELTGLRHKDVVAGAGAHLHCEGKGRKERITPLTKTTAAVLTSWIDRQGSGDDVRFVFPSTREGRLSSDAGQRIVARHAATACNVCPSLKKKRVTPHVLRHSAAMEFLEAGIDRALIAIWLGHESIETTQIYLDADLRTKEGILAKTRPFNRPPGIYRPSDQLLSFLKTL
jgi:integrase/recombinase XerD